MSKFSRYEQVPLNEIQSIALLRASVGPHDMCIEVDPYYDADDWHEAARGDGRSYGGSVETVHRLPGESFKEFKARAERRADELDAAEYRR
jgi:hypothetical protein